MSTYINAIQAEAVTKEKEKVNSTLSGIGFDFLRQPSTEVIEKERFAKMFCKVFNDVMRFK
ncbi:hypothetical protein FLL45_18795 [Aliikangiella marina]|uniref:Uncharacterized protein n=1 Tax=Aliikangiella marina TaxID=1712262 RepID=A0A545T524_9GAMM|nr:hypothetical protein [Aliikangiella marina]TQV72268.1 hypothetical protein FLL45_18795 [Aliikangiella marina]